MILAICLGSIGLTGPPVLPVGWAGEPSLRRRSLGRDSPPPPIIGSLCGDLRRRSLEGVLLVDRADGSRLALLPATHSSRARAWWCKWDDAGVLVNDVVGDFALVLGGKLSLDSVCLGVVSTEAGSPVASCLEQPIGSSP
jgi:hypothetical protein